MLDFFRAKQSGEIAAREKSWLLFEGVDDTFLYDLMRKRVNSPA